MAPSGRRNAKSGQHFGQLTVRCDVGNSQGLGWGYTQVRLFLKVLGSGTGRPGGGGGGRPRPTPVAQREFHDRTLKPLLDQAVAGARKVFFADAAHFVRGVFLAHLRCFARWVVPTGAGHQRYSVLAALDAADRTLVRTVDPCCLTERFRILCVSVLNHGSALPVAWTIQTPDQIGSWNEVWFDLLGQLKAAIGEGWTVLVLTDRGLESANLFREIVRLGWHPMMRAKRNSKFQPTGWHRGQWMSDFAESVGRRWTDDGVADPDGLACDLSECRLVWVADVDRAGFSGDQARVLAVAYDADDRSVACGSVVGSDRSGHGVHDRDWWGGTTGETALDSEEIEYPETGVVANPDGIANTQVLAGWEDRAPRLARKHKTVRSAYRSLRAQRLTYTYNRDRG